MNYFIYFTSCFSIIRRSDRLVTGMVHLQSGFCHKLGLPFNDPGAGDNFMEIILPSFSRHLAGKTVNLDVISTQNLS